VSTPNPQSDAPSHDGTPRGLRRWSPRPADGSPAAAARARRRSRQRRRVANVAGLMAALVLTGALYSALSPAYASQETTATESSAEAAGRELYERSCISLPRREPRGRAQPGPLAHRRRRGVRVLPGAHRPHARWSARQAQAPDKPAIFSDEEIDQLMAYVQANGGGPTLPSGDLPRRRPRRRAVSCSGSTARPATTSSARAARSPRASTPPASRTPTTSRSTARC
jgi:ubiquinol-cytochrome c reductase cytochrome c subunit